MPQFIVRTHPFIEDGKRWASGVVLELGGARALVRADTYERTVEVTATGLDSARQQLAGLCQAELRAIHLQFRGLEIDEETYAAGQWVPVQTLERDEAHGRKTGVATSRGTVEVDPAIELNAFSAPAARDDSWKPRIFISYSHQDEAQRKKLDLHLKVLATQGLVDSTWHDRKIQPREDWDRTIRNEIESADVILFLVSTASLASNYIHTVEMNVALKRHNEKRAILIPIILERCVWDALPLKGSQALSKEAAHCRKRKVTHKRSTFSLAISNEWNL